MLTPHPSFPCKVCPKTGILLVWSDRWEGSATPGCRNLSSCTHHQGLLSPLPTSGGVPQLLRSFSLSQGEKVAPDALSCVCLEDLLVKVRNTASQARCSCVLCPALQGLLQSETPWSCCGKGSRKCCCILLASFASPSFHEHVLQSLPT